MPLTLSLSKALLCLATQCWPVLIGSATPGPGEYPLAQRITSDPGYGGDVLQFAETNDTVYAIHRVWTLRPEERRRERLKNPDPKARFVTKGCVNVDEAVYNVLIAEYLTANISTLTISP